MGAQRGEFGGGAASVVRSGAALQPAALPPGCTAFWAARHAPLVPAPPALGQMCTRRACPPRTPARSRPCATRSQVYTLQLARQVKEKAGNGAVPVDALFPPLCNAALAAAKGVAQRSPHCLVGPAAGAQGWPDVLGGRRSCMAAARLLRVASPLDHCPAYTYAQQPAHRHLPPSSNPTPTPPLNPTRPWP